MIVLQKDKMLDGTEVQLEDWGLNRTLHPMTPPDTKTQNESFRLVIGIYPKAIRSGRYGHPRPGEKFRLIVSSNRTLGYTDVQIKRDYEDLLSGAKTIADLQEYFWNGQQDRWVLGLTEENPFEQEEEREV